MKDLKFRVWHLKENKMYYRGYQRLLNALLCENDLGENEGKGKPVKIESYDNCEFLESTSFIDKNGQEVYEGDIINVRYKDIAFCDVVGAVPDMFGSKGIHPLQSVLEKHGIKGNPERLDVEVIGNKFENPELLR